MRSSRLLLVAALVGAVALTGSGAGADTLDVGSTGPLPEQLSACSARGFFFQDAVGRNPSYTAPGGVITSWSTTGNTFDVTNAALKVGREGPGDTYTVLGGTAVAPVVQGRVNTFLTRVPIAAGDTIGLYLATDGGCAFAGQAGDVVRYRTGGTAEPTAGTTYVTDSTVGGSPQRLNLSARVEPDADGDGYGDLTQDACPALKNSHTDCAAPDTLLAESPGKVVTRKKSAKVTARFYASETGTTSTCAVDTAAPSPCASPLTLKLKPGRHVVAVTATDAVGNVDPSPLKFAVKVKRAAHPSRR